MVVKKTWGLGGVSCLNIIRTRFQSEDDFFSLFKKWLGRSRAGETNVRVIV